MSVNVECHVKWQIGYLWACQKHQCIVSHLAQGHFVKEAFQKPNASKHGMSCKMTNGLSFSVEKTQ